MATTTHMAARMPRARISALAILVVLTVGIATPAVAQEEPPVPEPSNYETPRTVALGTGARASAMSTSAVAANASGMLLSRLYHVEGLLDYRPGGGWVVGGAAADSVTSKVAAGISFRGVFDEGKAEYDGYDGRLSLAVPLGDKLSVGVSGRYLKLRPDSQKRASGNGVKGFTMDASVTVSPIEQIRISALGANLIDRGSALTPMTVGGGAAFTIANRLTFGGEGLVDLSTFDGIGVLAGGGLEYLAGGVVPLRVGYRYDGGREIHSVSGGIGYVDRQVGVDLSLRQHVKGDAGRQDTRLVFSVRYHAQ